MPINWSVSAMARSISEVSEPARAQPRLGLFQPLAQPVERGAQIMRHRIGDFAQALHQPLDAVQHAVEIFRQHVELVMRAGHRHAAGEIAGDDFARSAVDGIQPAQHVAAHQGAAEQAEHQDQAHRPGQGGGEHALGEIAVMHILGDQQIEIAARRLQREQPPARAAGHPERH